MGPATAKPGLMHFPDELIGVLCHFQQYFCHIMATAHIIHVFPVLRTKSVTKKEMNKCMAEIYDPGGNRTRAARLILSQYHNH